METLVFGKAVAQAILNSTITSSEHIDVQDVQLHLSEEGVDGPEFLTQIRELVREKAGIVRTQTQLEELQEELEELHWLLEDIGMQDV